MSPQRQMGMESYVKKPYLYSLNFPPPPNTHTLLSFLFFLNHINYHANNFIGKGGGGKHMRGNLFILLLLLLLLLSMILLLLLQKVTTFINMYR